MVNISVLVSGGGTNLQAVIDGIKERKIRNAKINLVLSSNADAYALKRAGRENIHTVVINKDTEPDSDRRADLIIDALDKADTDYIILAGYMSILPGEIVKKYEKRIINIHPSLIPKHCGKGFYGSRVHESVIKAGDKESGATVHFVDEGVDTGEIIMQEKVSVFPDDSPDSLAERVLEVEHRILVKSVDKVINNQTE